MSMEKKIALTNFSDLVGADGKTFRQSNMEKRHNIPMGTLVQVVETPSGDCQEWRGVRLYVTGHNRDCDGTPLYSLGFKGCTNALMMSGGFGEEQLSPLDSPIRLTRGKDADWLRRVLDESSAGHEGGCLHCADVNEALDHRLKDLPSDIGAVCRQSLALTEEMEKTGAVCWEDVSSAMGKLRDYAIGIDTSKLEKIKKAIEMAIDMPLGNEDDGAPESVTMAFDAAFEVLGVPWRFGEWSDSISETGEWKEEDKKL